jgi:hypothetical protein
MDDTWIDVESPSRAQFQSLQAQVQELAAIVELKANSCEVQELYDALAQKADRHEVNKLAKTQKPSYDVVPMKLLECEEVPIPSKIPELPEIENGAWVQQITCIIEQRVQELANLIERLDGEKEPAASSVNEIIKTHNQQAPVRLCMSPCVGNRVRHHFDEEVSVNDREGNQNGWILYAHEVATVVELDEDGDFRLSNPRGVVSALLDVEEFKYDCEASCPEEHTDAQLEELANTSLACKSTASTKANMDQIRGMLDGLFISRTCDHLQSCEKHKSLSLWGRLKSRISVGSDVGKTSSKRMLSAAQCSLTDV